ncbi:MAG: hypothetical protein ABFS39_11620 [Pseudomonadota bacterium]
MRHLRWKRNYISGFSSLDRPKQALYENLQALQTEMEHKEHCQDMEDLMGDLNAQARSLFEVRAGSRQQIEGAVSKHTAAIAQTLDQQLPLAALETPACHDCGICEHTGESIREWLVQSVSPDDEEKEFAA